MGSSNSAELDALKAENEQLKKDLAAATGGAAAEAPAEEAPKEEAAPTEE